LRTLLGEATEEDDEYDEFSDLGAWQPHRTGDSG